jgi:phosphoglycolate phosphatase
MVGDTEWDLEMARRAGVAARRGELWRACAERLLPYAPLACIDAIGACWRAGLEGPVRP